MKKSILLSFIYWICQTTFAQSASLNPTSIQFPNVASLNQVLSPTSGMMVYNTTDKNLYLRNDQNWVKINNSALSALPTIYYTITPGTNVPPPEITSGVHAGQTRILSLDENISNAGVIVGGGGGSAKSILGPIVITKYHGPSTILFKRAVVLGTYFPTIEFFFYNSDDVLYYSMKLSNFAVRYVGDVFQEQNLLLNNIQTIHFEPSTIAWKDFRTSPATTGSWNISAGTWSTTY